VIEALAGSLAWLGLALLIALGWYRFQRTLPKDDE
jgi:hypothetical protein